MERAGRLPYNVVMGRRALRKVNPKLDLSRHLMTQDELPQPWDAVELFGRRAPLEIEVGTGKGLFMAGAGRARRDRDFLGIEVAGRYARFAAARLVVGELDNARIVHGDALRIFGQLLPDASIAAVHVYFPDPWWKKRHHKRRVMNERFVKDVERVLPIEGRLHFWTDVGEYFQLSLDLIARCTSLVGPLEVAERSAEHDLDYRTHFERRVRLSGGPVFRAEFRKAAR